MYPSGKRCTCGSVIPCRSLTYTLTHSVCLCLYLSISLTHSRAHSLSRSASRTTSAEVTGEDLKRARPEGGHVSERREVHVHLVRSRPPQHTATIRNVADATQYKSTQRYSRLYR